MRTSSSIIVLLLWIEHCTNGFHIVLDYHRRCSTFPILRQLQQVLLLVPVVPDKELSRKMLLFYNSLQNGMQPSRQRYSLNTHLHTTANDSAETNNNDNNINNDDNDNDNEGIDINLDPRLYKVRISRAAGIEWGTDLSFSFVYVRAIDPSGDAAFSGEIKVGDQLCEITKVNNLSTTVADSTTTTPQPVNVIGASFDFVMSTYAQMDKKVTEVDLVFFRGTKDELKLLCTGGTGNGSESESITVTVLQNKGALNEKCITLQAPVGVNVRQLLVDNNINVYQSITRWTNCKGKQLCGTCIVNVTNGQCNTNRKSMDEESTLRENPDSYRLSCITFAYGDITVETFPPIQATQWTR